MEKGYIQMYGIDYKEMFPPFTKMNIIRVLLPLTTNLNCLLHQLDIKNAFSMVNSKKSICSYHLALKKNNGREKVCKL